MMASKWPPICRFHGNPLPFLPQFSSFFTTFLPFSPQFLLQSGTAGETVG
jgi:hypothetical protein